MTITEAKRILEDYYDKPVPDENDEFLFTEALEFLITETKDPKYMTELAWYYCSKKRFDIELKYLEMAAECGYKPAFEELGYMWYYGQHGEQDYNKAFEYYTKGADDTGTPGSLWCKYKLADMYRFGCAVEKDEEKYRRLIEEAYERVKNPMYLNDPFPEIAYRLADIRLEDGHRDEAGNLLKEAKQFMAERLSLEAFWGHLEVMGRIIKRIYALETFDPKHLDLYDLFYLSDKPCTVSFKYRGKAYKLAISDDADNGICFEDKWYRNVNELCEKAMLNDRKLTQIYDEIYDMEVCA